MRLASSQPKLGKLRSRVADSGPRILRLSVSDLVGFDDVDVQLNNSFLAICGGTGIGKTTLLAALYSAVREIEEDQAVYQQGRPSLFRVKITISRPDGVYEEERSFVDEVIPSSGYGPASFYDEIDLRTGVARRSYHGDQIDILKDGTEYFDLDKEARAFLSQICRKSYSEIKVYEIEYENGLVYPFFEVKDGELSYSSEFMGTGEHSACYLAWRLSTSPPNSILCIEEPEAFLPPVAHRPMLDMIGHFALERRLLPIFSTHSSEIVSRLADGDSISLSRRKSNIYAPKTTEAKIKVLVRLGLMPNLNSYALVEDEVGRVILEEILAMYNFQLVVRTETIVMREGAGAINNALKDLPAELPKWGVFGVLDGDMREETKKWKSRDRLVLTPFDNAPEIELLDAVDENLVSFSGRIQRPPAVLEQILAQTRGEDHHDRFRNLATGLGVGFETLVKVAFQHWIIVRKKRAKVRAFAKELAELLGTTPPDM